MKMKVSTLFKSKKLYRNIDKVLDKVKMLACECAWRDDESNTCYMEDKIGVCDERCPFWRK